jgi:O-antigen/teichoic acid export membrane protein
MLFLPQVAQEVYLVLDKTMIGLLGTSVDQVGYYSQAQKIVKVVLSIATSLGTVMLPAMSASFSKGDHEGIVKSIKTAFRFIYMLSFALFFGLCAIASKFVPLFFGDGYEPVILLMIVISPILVIISTSNVIGKQYLLPTNQQKEYTFSIIAGAVVNFLINLVFIPLLDSIGASIATVLAEIAVTAVQCWCVKDQLPLRDCLLSGARYLGYGLIMYLAVKMVGSLFSESTIWAIGTMIIVGMVVYGSELVLFKDPVVAMGIAFYKKRSQSN